jgi:hypothetical protein
MEENGLTTCRSRSFSTVHFYRSAARLAIPQKSWDFYGRRFVIIHEFSRFTASLTKPWARKAAADEYPQLL